MDNHPAYSPVDGSRSESGELSVYLIHGDQFYVFNSLPRILSYRLTC